MGKNEGEGSRSAAKRYNEATKQFAQSGRVEGAAKEARKALEGAEGEQLKQAEATGRAAAKEEDPAVKKPGRPSTRQGE